MINVPKCFTPLLGHISSFALKECLNQFNKIKKINPTEQCLHTVTIGLEIPCSHRIRKRLKSGDALDPANFHFHRHLKYDPEITTKYTPKFDLNDKVNIIFVALSNKDPKKQEELIKQNVAGTHSSISIQVPKVL
ncbi:hypothetical protein PCANC_10124 [Puccinia coronata f. sp. avenae]|uniref:Uncharacterized protein n=1 Tax=Puccinia coronata f. sp. avenae TaxID=200324 RepID=A0A2N5V785_9BASI|nr:hypothetical protein PCANC_10124 [Puccinia coronata f. sp. avenae]